MEPSKTSQTRWNDTTTHLHHPYILCHFANYALHVFVSCVHSRVVGGSWEGIAGCVVHVAVHGYEVPFVFQPNALFYNKVDVSTAILQSSLEDTQHAQNTAVYTVHAVYPDCRIAFETSAFF